jgi:hypothetical protein
MAYDSMAELRGLRLFVHLVMAYDSFDMQVGEIVLVGGSIKALLRLY